MDFNLLLVLPDINNKRILARNANGIFYLPTYTESVAENVAFGDARAYNDFFQAITGIPVYRRYTFNTPNDVVFVFEQIDNAQPKAEFDWVLYDDFIAACNADEIAEIANNVRLHYNQSKAMPWIEYGFLPYFTWLRAVCDKNHIQITGDITQLKNAYVSTVFRIPTNMGDIYMKIPGKFFITELLFTQGLKKLQIADLPHWIDYDIEMNVILMKDMGGHDLPNESGAETLREVILHFAKIQKDSIPHMPPDFFHYDNTVDTMLGRLDAFPEKAFEILSGTKYELTQNELKRLQSQVLTTVSMLKSINAVPIPNTIHHGDVRPGNIRVIGGNHMFYDWAWGAVSHPFIDIVSFLHIIRRTLDEPAQETLIDAYLQQWQNYDTYDQLRHAFSTLSTLKDLFFALTDYDWCEAIHLQAGSVCAMSADGWLVDKRNYYVANVIRRFIETPLSTYE